MKKIFRFSDEKIVVFKNFRFCKKFSFYLFEI